MANLNELAKKVCAREGLKVEVNVAQVKEILKVLGKILFDSPDYVAALINHGEFGGKKSAVKGKAEKK